MTRPPHRDHPPPMPRHRRRRRARRRGRAPGLCAGDHSAGLPDQHLGHADLLPHALGPLGEARHQVRGVSGPVRQSHHAADGGAPGRRRHLCRAVDDPRQRQGRPRRHRPDRICRTHHPADGAQGPRHHHRRATPRQEDRQPDRVFDRQCVRRHHRAHARPQEGRLPRKSAWT